MIWWTGSLRTAFFTWVFMRNKKPVIFNTGSFFCFNSTISYTCISFNAGSILHIMLRSIHCRQKAPVEHVLSASGTSHLGMIDIQATTKSKYYDHIVLLYLESRRCRHLSIIFVCFYLYVTVVNFIDYSDMDKMMDINNDKC